VADTQDRIGNIQVIREVSCPSCTKRKKKCWEEKDDFPDPPMWFTKLYRCTIKRVIK
jgi:hypothetical protein